MHVHLTVDSSLEEMQAKQRLLPKGVKVTPIRLWRGDRSQLDTMFTLHCGPDGFRRLFRLADQVRAVGFPIVRFKIEDDFPVPGWQYLEIHARSPTLEPTDPSASYSQNLVLSDKGLFQTFRMQDFRESDQKVAELQAQGFTEIWQEAVVVDDHPELDAWWCPVV